VVWVNSTNLFDAACGFGGYRESGFGREGGREGLLEYLEPMWFKEAPALPKSAALAADEPAEDESAVRDAVATDRTVKLYIGGKQASAEVSRSIERIFSYAAWADKFDGAVHNPPFRNVSIAMNEPIGTIALICPVDAPLLGFLSLALAAIAMGNTTIAIPSER